MTFLWKSSEVSFLCDMMRQASVNSNCKGSLLFVPLCSGKSHGSFGPQHPWRSLETPHRFFDFQLLFSCFNPLIRAQCALQWRGHLPCFNETQPAGARNTILWLLIGTTKTHTSFHSYAPCCHELDALAVIKWTWLLGDRWLYSEPIKKRIH